jgi:hypothetical protein
MITFMLWYTLIGGLLSQLPFYEKDDPIVVLAFWPIYLGFLMRGDKL